MFIALKHFVLLLKGEYSLAHLHITGWVLAIILLFVVNNYYKKDKGSRGKILHMILRLFYLVILFSGISLFFMYDQIGSELVIKVIAGLWAIVSMEMITVRASKGNPTNSWWIQFVIAVLIAIILGFGRLPLGVLP